MRNRTQASHLLETLLPLLGGDGDTEGARGELPALLAWAFARCSEREQATLGQRLVLAGIVPIPERPGAELLEQLARRRFRGDPGAHPGAGRIPLRYWALGEGVWPFTFDADDLPMVGRLKPADSICFAAWLDDSVRRRGDADQLPRLVAQIRGRATSAAAEHAIECVLALHAPGSPGEVEDLRFEALTALARRAPEPLLSRLMHAMDPSDLETRLASREIEPAAALRLARAAMALPHAFRQATCAGLRAHLVAALDADFP
ncbi:MAG: hypothetical protein FJ104_08940, partial [Deltaproteobacteria bacterium]|nr:hypothetical protein [Deltaproteobacteria bacterium]